MNKVAAYKTAVKRLQDKVSDKKTHTHTHGLQTPYTQTHTSPFFLTMTISGVTKPEC